MILYNKSYISDFISTGDESNDYFDSELDGPAVIKVFNNMKINVGHTVTTKNRCKGLYLYILGDLIINGTLSMSERGPKVSGQFIGINIIDKTIEFNDNDIFSNKSDLYKYNLIHKNGSSGGLAQSRSARGVYPGNNGLSEKSDIWLKTGRWWSVAVYI